MLKFYLTTILIYVIIMICALIVFGKKIMENGWVDKTKKSGVFKAIIYLIAVCAIPIWRFIVLIGFVVTYSITKEQYDKMNHSRKDDE